MRLLFAGTPASAIPSLELLLSGKRHEVVAVLTRPDARAGRGRRPARAPVAERAEAAGVEVLSPPSAKDPQLLRRLKELAPDAAAVVAYGALVPPAALAVPRHGWVNLHFSLLPAWRGAAPVQAAIRAGDDLTGASTFLLVKELDAGPVYGTLTEPIHPTDTAGDLLARLSRAGARLLAETLDGIEDGVLTPRPQPREGVSYAPKIEVSDARVDWSLPPFAVDRLVRACTPEPGAWTTFRGRRLKLGPVAPSAEPAGLAPGELRAGPDAVLVGAGSDSVRLGTVRLGTVQPEGKRPVPAIDWARGARLAAGDRLG